MTVPSSRRRIYFAAQSPMMRRMFWMALLMFAGLPDVALGQAGRSCSIFNQCPNGYSCMPFRQVCHRDDGAQRGEACQAGYSCANGLTCEAGTQVCRGPGLVGEPCHLTRPCSAGLTCEAGTQVCRGPGRAGDACHATRPCGNGLTCEAGTQVCRAPSQLGEACHATRPCGDGLTCQPGVQRCYHSPRKAGEPCVAGFSCGEGLYCQSFLQKCAPKTVNFNDSSSACSALRVQATAEDARRAGITMNFGGGSSGGAGAFVSYETGVVYGATGEFGCYATACTGAQSNVSIGNFASMGISGPYSDFEGFSVVTSQGVDTPFLQLGFQTSQVFSAAAPSQANEILKNRLTGTSSGLTFGVGLSPITVGTSLCYTARLDSGDPLSKFSDIQNLLSGWAKMGFSPESRPTQLSNGGSTQAPVAAWRFCANENQNCSLARTSTVRYGAQGRFVTRRMNAGTFSCSNTVFGDPVPNVVKACEVQDGR